MNCPLEFGPFRHPFSSPSFSQLFSDPSAASSSRTCVPHSLFSTSSMAERAKHHHKQINLARKQPGEGVARNAGRARAGQNSGGKRNLNNPKPRARRRRPPHRTGLEAPRCATPGSVARRRHAAAARPRPTPKATATAPRQQLDSESSRLDDGDAAALLINRRDSNVCRVLDI